MKRTRCKEAGEKCGLRGAEATEKRRERWSCGGVHTLLLRHPQNPKQEAAQKSRTSSCGDGHSSAEFEKNYIEKEGQ